ncbi:MAG: hypothetical protein IJP29_07345 [Lachnospiraceae bacterium]|nr:hypothetical protein [Lachnospiraceae bacterium]
MKIIGKKELIVLVGMTLFFIVLKMPAGILLILFYLILLFAIFLLTMKDKAIDKKESWINHLADKRTQQLIGIITKVEETVDKDDFTEKVIIYCEYNGHDGKKYRFKSKQVLGIADCKVGEPITIWVDPLDYNNYYVQMYDVVQN